MDTHFDHERLDVYRASLDFAAVANDVVAQLPRGRGNIADQLERAATSIVLNIAEGSGEFAAKEKVRFYRMAKRSATECASLLDLASRLQLLADGDPLDRARGLLLRVVSMLIRLIQVTERPATRRVTR